MEMQPLSANSNIYKENQLNSELNEKECMGGEPLSNNIQHNNTGKERKLNSEFVDEESNNGPLDFSLHRVQDIVFNDRSNSCSSRRGKVPRVKLTLRETKEQRERRLQKGRDRMRNLRANETTEEREVRLFKARKCQESRRQRERTLESTFEREQRLAKARERTRLRREQETPDQREKRLRSTRERLRFKRLSESYEERQRRLYVQRERKKEKYHRMTPEEKELLRFGERHSKQYKTDAKPERRQTRGICIKYDTFEDDLDEALLKFQTETQHMTNDSEDASWLAEPEVCLSVGSMDNVSSDKNGKEKEEGSTANTQLPYDSNKTSIPPPQDLQEQLSQHISNVVMNISDSTKPSYERASDYKMNCYTPASNTQSNENYCSFQCNNNQSEYTKSNTNSSCVSSSASEYNVFHGGGREENRYQYCSQGYQPQSVNNQPPAQNSLGSENYPQGNNSIYPQPSQPVTQQSNYTKNEAPLNLHHHPQMIPRFDPS